MSTEYFDVVIVGAGLSGIGVAYHLQNNCPSKSYVILEGREAMGGTWDLFRYPGIRSDSDMYSYGYKFKPWRDVKKIADGASILEYLQETASENCLDRHIRYSHRVKKASWSSTFATWTIEIENREAIACNFLVMCSGYYSYENGYTPEFKGRDRFQGAIVHPQHWREDLDYNNKKVVIIGSGATAITLVPEMAKTANHVVMLQRSPTYIVSSPNEDKLANFLKKVLPEPIAYKIIRWKYIRLQQFFYNRARKRPQQVKEMLLDGVRQQLNQRSAAGSADSNHHVETHFTPRYNPWEQRLCLVPNSDLFQALNSGKASVVTDSIETFTEKGILLKSGQELETDIIVTATGLNLLLLGGVEFVVDDQPVDFSETYIYKGLMYSDVPNMVSIFGYINASWTLRADLMAEYICRVINLMDKRGCRQCTPRLREEDHTMQAHPFIEEFSSNYLQRVMHLLPKQGDRAPWINPQNYRRDKKMLRHSAIEDGVLVFSN